MTVHPPPHHHCHMVQTFLTSTILHPHPMLSAVKCCLSHDHPAWRLWSQSHFNKVKLRRNSWTHNETSRQTRKEQARPCMTEHSKNAWAASEAEREVTASPDVSPAFHGTTWHKQPKSRRLFQQHHQHFLGEPFTKKIVIFPRILRTDICFCLGREIYKGCIQSYIF